MEEQAIMEQLLTVTAIGHYSTVTNDSLADIGTLMAGTGTSATDINILMAGTDTSVVGTDITGADIDISVAGIDTSGVDTGEVIEAVIIVGKNDDGTGQIRST